MEHPGDSLITTTNNVSLSYQRIIYIMTHTSHRCWWTMDCKYRISPSFLQSKSHWAWAKTQLRFNFFALLQIFLSELSYFHHSCGDQHHKGAEDRESPEWHGYCDCDINCEWDGLTSFICSHTCCSQIISIDFWCWLCPASADTASDSSSWSTTISFLIYLSENKIFQENNS